MFSTSVKSDHYPERRNTPRFKKLGSEVPWRIFGPTRE
jgi:hypothetical protein